MCIQRSVITVKIIAPDICNQLFACQGDVAVIDHVEKKVVLLGRKFRLLSVNRDDSSGKIIKRL